MSFVTYPMINCTPHDVHVYDEAGKEIQVTYPRSDYVLRLIQKPQTEVGPLTAPNGRIISVYSPQEFGDVEGLPSYESGHCPDILVSLLVGQRLRENGAWPGGVFGPDTGTGAVRDEKGQIIGTKWLIQYSARKA